MKKIGRRLIIVGLELAILLTGCNREQVPEDIAFPERCSYEGEHLRIDADVITPENLTFYKGKGMPISIDYPAMGEELMGPEGYEAMGQEQGDTLVRDKYVFGWGELTNTCHYVTPAEWDLINSVYIEPNNPLYNLDAYTEQKEFSFATEQEALEEVKGFLNRYNLGIDDTWKITTYYLDHEILKEEENVMTMEMEDDVSLHKQDWSEADDAYLFFLDPYYGNYPDYHSNGSYSALAGPSGAPVSVIYGRTGIISLMIENPYSHEQTDTTVDLLPMDEIVERLRQRFDDVVGDNMYFYAYSMQLCADAKIHISDTEQSVTIPMPYKQTETDMIPVWAVRFTQSDGDFDEDGKALEIRVNAATGEIME